METEINKNTNAYAYEQLLDVNKNGMNIIMNSDMFIDLNKNKNPFKRLKGFIDEELLADYFGKTVEEFDDMIVAEDYYPQNYECWYIKLVDGESFTYDNTKYYNGDFIFYYNKEWIYIPNVDIYNEDDLARHKYLSALTNRFLPSYIINNFPNFVQFIREYLKICDNTWYKIICNIADYGNIDKMPDDILVLAVSQYAVSFTPNLKSIKYFYDSKKNQYRYDNIRNFLRISRRYLSCKGTAQSIFFLYDMLFFSESNIKDTNVEIVLPYERILKLSDYNAIVRDSKGSNPESGSFSDENTDDKSIIEYVYPSALSGRNDAEYYTYEYDYTNPKAEKAEESKYEIKDEFDLVEYNDDTTAENNSSQKIHFYDNLSHLHGTDIEDIDDMGEEVTYGYYTVLLHHNLENPKEFAEMFEELIKPTGVRMVWKKMDRETYNDNKTDTFEIYNEEEDMKIYPYNLHFIDFCDKDEISFRVLRVNKNDRPVIETPEQGTEYIVGTYETYGSETTCENCLKKMMNFNTHCLYKDVENCPFSRTSQCPLLILDKDESVTIEYKVEGKTTDTNLQILTSGFERLDKDRFPLMEYMDVLIKGNSSTK